MTVSDLGRRDGNILFQPNVQLFEPATSQPIWIKFSTHLLLYGIHLWADLDRDRRRRVAAPDSPDYQKAHLQSLGFPPVSLV